MEIARSLHDDNDDDDNDDKALEVRVQQSSSYDDSHDTATSTDNSWSSNDMRLEDGLLEEVEERVANEETSLLMSAAQHFGYHNDENNQQNNQPQSRFDKNNHQNSPNATSSTIQSSSSNNNNKKRPSLARLKLQSSMRKITAQMHWKKLATNVDHVLLEQGQPSPCKTATEKKKLREETVNEIRNSLEFSLWHCLCAIVLYLLVAVLAYSFLLDHMTVVDACYFAVTTFTTTGYGDVVPTTTAARYFTGLFALCGVASLGIVLGVIGNNIVDAQKVAVERAKKMSQKRAMELFETSTQLSCDIDTVAQLPKCKNILFELVVVTGLLTAFALLLWDDPGVDAGEGWASLGNAIYFSIITATTIGYGDYAPNSQKGRLCAIFLIPLAVGVMGHWLSIVATFIIERRQSHFRQGLTKKELTMQDLDIMDEDGDGQVTQMEFLEFMLLAMNKVDKETLASLREYFQKLDADGTGTLDKEDLISAAKKKLRMGSRKLELARYKRELMEKSITRRPVWSRASWSKSPQK